VVVVSIDSTLSATVFSIILINYKMATYNLKIDIGGLLGHLTFLFDLDEGALDYIQQTAGKHIIVYYDFITASKYN